MQMDMQEPGEMAWCCREERDLAVAQRGQAKMTGPHAGANHIIASEFPA